MKAQRENATYHNPIKPLKVWVFFLGKRAIFPHTKNKEFDGVSPDFTLIMHGIWPH